MSSVEQSSPAYVTRGEDITKDIVSFDVAGTIYRVARSTLMKFPETMLAAMVSQRWQVCEADAEQKPLFIDRDPGRFRYILDFYRDAQIKIPTTVTIAEMERDAEYFGLPLKPGDITHDQTDIISVRNGLRAFDREMVKRCGDEEMKLLGEAAACALVPMVIQKLNSCREEASASLTVRDVPDSHWVKAHCPRILDSKSLKRKAASLARAQGYKFLKRINSSSFCITYNN